MSVGPFEPLDLAWESVVAAVSQRRFGALKSSLVSEHVARLSEIYTRHREQIAPIGKGAKKGQESASETDNQSALIARLNFFLLRDMRRIERPFTEWALTRGFPDRPLRILDLGAGLGALSLGLLRLLKSRHPHFGAEVLAVDSSGASLELLPFVFEEAKKNELIRAEVKTLVSNLFESITWQRVALHGRFDVVLCGFVLNEMLLSDPESAARFFSGIATVVTDEAALFVLEPALKPTARALMSLRPNLVSAGWRILGPCTHEGECPLLSQPRDWCHADDAIELTKAQSQVARAAGLRHQGLTYSYLTLTRQREQPTTKRLRVVSGAISQKGQTKWWACGPGLTSPLLVRSQHRNKAEKKLRETIKRYDVLEPRSEEEVAELPTGAPAELEQFEWADPLYDAQSE